MSLIEGLVVGLVGVVALLVLLMAVLWLLGRRLPEGHVQPATLRLSRSPQEVFAAIADTAAIPSWDDAVDHVERIEDRDGREAWRWGMGRNSLVLVTTVNDPHRRLVRTIGDEAKFFSGTWTWEITPEDGGSSLTLTEHGRVHVAIPRAMMHYLPAIADPSLYLRSHLKRLAKKFGEKPRIEKGEYRSGD